MRDARLARWGRRVRALARWPIAVILALALTSQVAIGALALRLGPFAAPSHGKPTAAVPVAHDAARLPTPTPTMTPSPSPTPTPKAAPATANGCPVTADQTAAEQHVFALLNEHRAAAGVTPLASDPTLAAVARGHSCDMLRHQLMSHTGSDGSSPFQRIQAAGIRYSAAGENIGTATNYGLIGGVDMNDQNMMAEPLSPYDHHWNIVNAGYSRVGIGVVYANGQEWLTEDFVG